jgi:predicted ATP-binding protein involved in virulence
MLKKVIPSLHDVRFEKKSRIINYIEKDVKGQEDIYKAVSFSELATGVKSIIAMVGDIYLRFSSLMQKGVKTDEYFTPEDLYGIVIIDEIDLHLHPKWQKNLPSVLSEVFPNIQFIVSTHSAIPILGAPENSVLLRVNRNQEDGITVERLEHLEKQLKDLTPNLILTSEIFGFQDIFPITHDKSKRIRTEDTITELQENDEMMDALKSYMNTDKEAELLKLFSK